MLVSVIIINYNTFQLTCDCIDSIKKHVKNTSLEIIIVDNCSPTDNPDLFLDRYPDIKLVKSKENGGFAKGNNLGIQHSTGEILLLLNSDTILTEDCITPAVKRLQSDAEIGALSVRLNYADGKYQSNARKFRSIRNEILDLARPLLYLLPYRQRATLMLNQYFKGDFNTYCDWVSGAFLMVHRSALEKLPGGQLDERFFMYGEDHLWCYQLTQAGYKNFFLADASMIHIANASTESSKQIKLLQTLIERELEIMAVRKGKSLYYYCFKGIFVSKEQIRYLVKLIVYKLSGRRIR